MNTTLAHSPPSWLSLIASPVTVLGPSRGHIPDLHQYRIADMHLSPHSLCLYGSVTGLPPEAECNGERRGLAKFNLAMDLSLRELVSFSGQPALDPEYDDSNHSFQLALPVAVSIVETEEFVWHDAKHKVLEVVGASSHLRFHARAMFIAAYGGKHARKRYSDALRVAN